jgi:hypothetical protein
MRSVRVQLFVRVARVRSVSVRVKRRPVDSLWTKTTLDPIGPDAADRPDRAPRAAMATAVMAMSASNFYDGRVASVVQTDTQKLWESLEASRAMSKPRRARSTPRMRPATERVPPRRKQTPGEKALGVPLAPPPPVKQVVPLNVEKPKPPEPAPVPSDGQPADAVPAGAESPAAPGPKAKAAKATSDRSLRSASARKARPKTPKKGKAAKTQRVTSPPLVQPEWNSTVAKPRPPGEVANKYTLKGQMGTTGSLMVGGGIGDDLKSVAGSEFTTATGAVRVSRVTSSPTGRTHPNPERRADLRGADMLTNINYFAAGGAQDNDRKMKEAGWINSQAWFESLRYYPRGAEAAKNDDCEITFSGNTHGAHVPAEHLENDVRNRIGIASADPAWSAYQLPETWAPELEAKMMKLQVAHAMRTSKAS